MANKLNLIEPTLFDQTGHGFSYVQSLLSANINFGFDIHVWLDRRGKKLLSKHECTTHNYFFRPLRQLQKICLYLQLIRRPEIIFICTSDLWDLKILAFYARFFATPAKIFLHFHQFKQTATKLATLRKLAAQNPQITILTPTTKLAQIFIESGFTSCTAIPCPTFFPTRDIDSSSAQFSKILYAGAARSDKGFPLVIQLLQAMRTNNIDVPFEIQISAPNSQRYDQATCSALQQLQTIPANNLILHRQTLDQKQYLALFNNAICLLLYAQSSYNDKFSGIALDAFYAGCPIVTVKNTWMGDTAEKFQAGIALDSCELKDIQAAITKIMHNYAFYHANAKQAARELKLLHDPRNTLLLLVTE